MEHPKKPAAESKTQSLRGFRFILKGRIIEVQLVERLSQILIVIRFNGEKTCKNPRLNLLKTRQRRLARMIGCGDRVPHRRAKDVLDAGDHKAHLAGVKNLLIQRLGGKDTELIDEMALACRHQNDLLFPLNGTINDSDQGDHTKIIIKP